MRINWQYRIFLGGLLSALAVTVVSCSKDSTSPVSAAGAEDPNAADQRLVDLQTKYAWAGTYHTEALAHVYEKLARGKPAASKAELCQSGINAIRDFNKTFSKDGRSKGLRDDLITPDLCAGDLQALVSSATVDLAATPSPYSPAATALLQKLQRLFASGASAKSIVARAQSIEREASATLNATEAAVVIGAASIAISSAEYWDANLVSWRGAPGLGTAATRRSAGVSPSATAPSNAEFEDIDDPLYYGGGVSIGKVDLTTFISNMILGWWMGAIDIEISAVRAAIASMMAAFG